MKIKSDYVTNSSSTSYLLAVKKTFPDKYIYYIIENSVKLDNIEKIDLFLCDYGLIDEPLETLEDLEDMLSKLVEDDRGNDILYFFYKYFGPEKDKYNIYYVRENDTFNSYTFFANNQEEFEVEKLEE